MRLHDQAAEARKEAALAASEEQLKAALKAKDVEREAALAEAQVSTHNLPDSTRLLPPSSFLPTLVVFVLFPTLVCAFGDLLFVIVTAKTNGMGSTKAAAEAREAELKEALAEARQEYESAITTQMAQSGRLHAKLEAENQELKAGSSVSTLLGGLGLNTDDIGWKATAARFVAVLTHPKSLTLFRTAILGGCFCLLTFTFAYIAFMIFQYRSWVFSAYAEDQGRFIPS